MQTTKFIGLDQKTQQRKIVIIFILSLLTLCFVFLLSQINLDGVLRFSDRLAVLPTVEAHYSQIVTSVLNATNDTLIKKEVDERLGLARQLYAGCIRGGLALTYGTNRVFNEITADFDRVFLKLGWKKETDGKTSTGYRIESAVVGFKLIDPSSPDFATWEGKYRTVYSVVVTWGDPSLPQCYG